ncbi:putative ATP-grasp superfamily ATP-dependent carboligase [Stackebrandtia albiflava]|uniref:Putative ATP-grasp superfamily ATP-dependent carboligase n=1 Tax=Stackebrandtia albiflava TaxID=406432 RepID=A0A562VDA0_9ACTN|nr:PAC2 family protein [Stackebrandtia albiflava]TWJ15835.1 putative ATP-grasp superfamily ATP-dependent carboligase [Stackebrandtia albiflava]
MSEPRELYEIVSDVPSGAVLLTDFRGFMDAGSAAEGVSAYLLETFEHELVARFDVDGLVDYRSRRPSMTFAADHWEDYDAPRLEIHLLHDELGTPFLLLSGSEPDVQWERFVAAVRGLIERWGVRLTVGMHGIPMGAPHTRPLGVTPHATRAELLGNRQSVFNRLRVPGNVAALLELRLGEAGHDAMGFAVHVPHYLAQSNYPAASVTLLEAVADATGLSVPLDELRDSAREVDAEVDAQVRASSEVKDVVEALERQYDMFVDSVERDSLLADESQLPTADELGAELERFLADQRRGDA